MKNFCLLFIVPFCLSFYSCDSEVESPSFTDNTIEEVEIRIDNQSLFIMENIIVNTGSNENTYPWVGSYGSSSFQHFFYSYATVSLSFLVGQKQFEHLDSNYVGNKLSAGQYNLAVYDIDTLLLTFSFRLSKYSNNIQ